ncbi:MAG: hypothetical protein WEA56_10690 [Balneolaceae bacterium]
MNIKYTGAILVVFLCFPFCASAQQSVSDLGFSGQFFFSYERLFEDQAVNNVFAMRRGYITFRKDLSPYAQIRFTQDVTVDQEGDGEGDIELRLKYALVKLRANSWGIFTKPSVEIGVVHRPWLDFEQGVNDYRAQGSMFLDEKRILSSADYGVTFSTLLGGEMDEEYQERVQSSFAGRYGSLSMGIYNGGGYSSLEENNNKLLEGRLSIRPLPDILPGFQTSFTGALGKGNIPDSPEFWLASSALSFESEKFITLLQGFYSTGDAAGRFVTPMLEPLDLMGWSTFTELKPFRFPVSFIFRADEFLNRDSGIWRERSGVAGIAYRFKNSSKILVDVNQTWTNGVSVSTFRRLEIITEIRF